MRKFIALTMTLVMVLGLATTGCGSQTESESTNAEDNQEQTQASVENGGAGKTDEGPVTLSIWWAEEDSFKAPLLEAIREFEDANPGIRIEPQWTPNFDYYENYKIALAGGEAPDIVKIDHVFVQTLGYSGQIYDLTDMGANSVKDQFVPSTWEANMYKDQVFALPFDANTLALLYNKDMFNEAGLQPPTTLEELIQISNELSSPEEGVYGYTIPFEAGVSGFLSFQFVGWIARNGGSILNDDWSAATVNTPEVINALEQVKSLVETGAAPANAFMEPDFYAGQIGMLEMGPWHVPTITAEDAAADFGVAPVVSLKDGVPTYAPLGLYSLALTKETAHPEEAYKFIEFLATNEAFQLAYSKTTNLMPSLTSLYDDEFYDNDIWQVFIEQLQNTVSRPGTPAWPQVDQALNDAIQKVLLDVATPEEALAEAEAKINEELAKLK